MNDNDDMGDLFDEEPPEEPNDEPEDIHSNLSDFLNPDYGFNEDGSPEEEEFSIQVDPRVIDRMEEFYGLDQFDPSYIFIDPHDITDWSEVRGQHFATQLGALEYILEGGMQAFAHIFYDLETDSYQVYVSYSDTV